MGKENLITDFYEVDERLAAGWYVCSGQRKRYLKTLIKDKKRIILYQGDNHIQ